MNIGVKEKNACSDIFQELMKPHQESLQTLEPGTVKLYLNMMQKSDK